MSRRPRQINTNALHSEWLHTDPVDRITAARLIDTHAKARHLLHDPG
jgi:PIN domain nuclease of toxin-antitoxin system